MLSVKLMVRCIKNECPEKIWLRQKTICMYLCLQKSAALDTSDQIQSWYRCIFSHRSMRCQLVYDNVRVDIQSMRFLDSDLHDLKVQNFCIRWLLIDLSEHHVISTDIKLFKHTFLRSFLHYVKLMVLSSTGALSIEQLFRKYDISTKILFCEH